jgi:hypothetical protein
MSAWWRFGGLGRRMLTASGTAEFTIHFPVGESSPAVA